MKNERIASVWISAVVGTVLVLCGLAFLRLDLTVRSTGTVLAANEVRVFAPAAGVIARHHAEVGQDVQAGDVLIELDDADLALRAVELQRALTETDAARARNDIALRENAIRPASAELLTADDRKDRLERISAIQAQIEKSYASGHDLQIISELELRRQEIEKLRAELDLLQASILADWQKAGVPAFENERLLVEQRRLTALHDLTRHELDLVEAQRAAMRITSPLAGRVVSVEYRFPGMAVQKGDELLKVASLDDHYRVLTRVPERNVDLVRAGTPVLMESEVFDSMLEGYITGTVANIAPESEDAAATEAGLVGSGSGREPALYDVSIVVDKTPHPLVLGSRVRVILRLGKRPLADVFFRSARSLRGRAEREKPSHE